jgi:protocatechuate 3,4-dioxygenase beta subunit
MDTHTENGCKLPDYGIIDDASDVTGVVQAAMAGTPNPRLREIMACLVTHLHDFAREVRITEDEYDIAIDMLNRIGKSTHDAHNEGILLADVLGFSTLVCLLNNGSYGATETAAALLGPFWRDHSPMTPQGGSIVRSPTPGPALFVNCIVTDAAGKPIEGAEIDIWQASPTGFYENQDAAQANMNLRGRIVTDREGRFRFRSVKPAGYPVPTDGPVGDILRAQLRHPFRPAHLHVLSYKQGFKTLITQVFVDDDERLGSDVVFGVTRHLVGTYIRHENEAAPAPDVEGPWYSLEYHFVMEPGEAKRPVAPIK